MAERVPTSLARVTPRSGTFFADMLAGRETDQFGPRQSVPAPQQRGPRTVNDLPGARELTGPLAAGARRVADRINQLQPFTAQDFMPGANASRWLQKIMTPEKAQRLADQANAVQQKEINTLTRLQLQIVEQQRLSPEGVSKKLMAEMEADLAFKSDPRNQQLIREIEDRKAFDQRRREELAGIVGRDVKLAGLIAARESGQLATDEEFEEARKGLFNLKHVSTEEYLAERVKSLDWAKGLNDEDLKSVGGALVWDEENNTWTSHGETLRTTVRSQYEKNLKKAQANSRIATQNTAFAMGSSIDKDIDQQINWIMTRWSVGEQLRDSEGNPATKEIGEFATEVPMMDKRPAWPSHGYELPDGTIVRSPQDFKAVQRARRYDALVETGLWDDNPEFLEFVAMKLDLIDTDPQAAIARTEARLALEQNREAEMAALEEAAKRGSEAAKARIEELRIQRERE